MSYSSKIPQQGRSVRVIGWTIWSIRLSSMIMQVEVRRESQFEMELVLPWEVIVRVFINPLRTVTFSLYTLEDYTVRISLGQGWAQYLLKITNRLFGLHASILLMTKNLLRWVVLGTEPLQEKLSSECLSFGENRIVMLRKSKLSNIFAMNI